MWVTVLLPRSTDSRRRTPQATIRASLSSAERSVHLKRRKVIYEAMHVKARRAAAVPHRRRWGTKQTPIWRMLSPPTPPQIGEGKIKSQDLRLESIRQRHCRKDHVAIGHLNGETNLEICLEINQ